MNQQKWIIKNPSGQSNRTQIVNNNHIVVINVKILMSFCEFASELKTMESLEKKDPPDADLFLPGQY